MVEVDPLKDMGKTETLVDTLAYRVKKVDVQTVCYTIAELHAETLLYAQADRQPVVEKENVANMPANVKCKAVLRTLTASFTHLATHCPS